MCFRFCGLPTGVVHGFYVTPENFEFDTGNFTDSFRFDARLKLFEFTLKTCTGEKSDERPRVHVLKARLKTTEHLVF